MVGEYKNVPSNLDLPSELFNLGASSKVSIYDVSRYDSSDDYISIKAMVGYSRTKGPTLKLRHIQHLKKVLNAEDVYISTRADKVIVEFNLHKKEVKQ